MLLAQGFYKVSICSVMITILFLFKSRLRGKFALIATITWLDYIKFLEDNTVIYTSNRSLEDWKS